MVASMEQTGRETSSAEQPQLESASIDRFEGRIAVLLLSETQHPIDVPRRMVPKGARAGSLVRIERDGERVVRIERDDAATAAAQLRIAEKLARLRRGEHL